jgi:hypothetical protein
MHPSDSAASQTAISQSAFDCPRLILWLSVYRPGGDHAASRENMVTRRHEDAAKASLVVARVSQPRTCRTTTRQLCDVNQSLICRSVQSSDESLSLYHSNHETDSSPDLPVPARSVMHAFPGETGMSRSHATALRHRLFASQIFPHLGKPA